MDECIVDELLRGDLAAAEKQLGTHGSGILLYCTFALETFIEHLRKYKITKNINKNTIKEKSDRVLLMQSQLLINYIRNLYCSNWLYQN